MHGEAKVNENVGGREGTRTPPLSPRAAFSRQGGKVESIAMAEGRILNPDLDSYQYEYYMQDHLYTNRVTFRPNADGTLSLGEVQNYYPLGGDMGDATINYSASPQNLYQYEGKEWQPELNLNTFDFGARHYDPVLGRWGVADLLAGESAGFSPYNYVEDNPITLMDPYGLQPTSPAAVSQMNNFINGTHGGVTSINLSFCSGCQIVGGAVVFGSAVTQTLTAIKDFGYHETTKPTPHGFNKVQGNTNKVNINGNSASQGGNATGDSNGIKDFTSGLTMGLDAVSTTIAKGNVIMKATTGTFLAGKAFKTFTRSGTVVGAIAGGLPTAYNIGNDLINGKSIDLRDVASLSLAGLGVVSEFTGLGELWDGTAGLIIAGGSLSYDIWDATHPEKK